MKRFEVWLTRLDPAEGSEMRKTRPAVILSPDEMNARLHTVVVAPLTSGGFAAPFRVSCRVDGVNGQIALDHLRSLAKSRCLRHLASLESNTCAELLKQLQEMFKT
ncbi:MAG TPA: type II toxin-antitoxin system PemK/MazF family toxin [Candidatus Saccharimonadales bacterium]|nr:type II toxin-antitoxin system PemK/MazF family toxin [Candidatus Saccharimonadales bacterium]